MIDLLESERVKTEIEGNAADVQNIINSSSLAICVTAEDHTFSYVNDNYCALYGYNRDELIGKSFTLVVPDDNKETMALLHDKFMQDKQEIARDWKVQGKDGNLITISVDAGYTDKVNGKPHKITLIQAE